MVIDFFVATSADMQKLTWRTSGPQNVFIQKMVDFFWNVGTNSNPSPIESFESPLKIDL